MPSVPSLFYPTVHRPILHYFLSYLRHPTLPFIPYYIPSYPLHSLYTPRFPSVYILLHATLSYSSVPYPKLLHPTPTETRPKWPGVETFQGWNDSSYWANSAYMYHQVIRPKRLGGSDSWPKIYWLSGTKLFLVSRDFGPSLVASDVSESRRFGTKPLNTPGLFGTKTFRHQNIATQDGWMDGWMVGWMDGWMDGITYFNYMYYVRKFWSI